MYVFPLTRRRAGRRIKEVLDLKAELFNNWFPHSVVWATLKVNFGSCLQVDHLASLIIMAFGPHFRGRQPQPRNLGSTSLVRIR